MRKSMKILAGVFTIAAGVAAASGLYAHEDGGSRADGSANNSPGIMGMMQMMGNDGAMMEGCRQMMQGMSGGQGTGKPNEQWRRDAPAKPDKKG